MKQYLSQRNCKYFVWKYRIHIGKILDFTLRLIQQNKVSEIRFRVKTVK